jgi:GT2 family glycosyltransferase
MFATSGYAARVVIAIPAKNEADFITACLAALSRQTFPADDVVVVINNTSDDTARRAGALAASLPSRLHIEELTLPPPQANAGYVRRLAMERAAQLAGPRGVIMTTDADARVPPNWIERNLVWLSQGYDAVCGMAVIDPDDERGLPRNLLADDALETSYTQISDEIDDLIDPHPWDPWPRHTHRSGASIAVRAAVHCAVGGVPDVKHSEDRGFVARLELRDCKIRHDPALRVIVSGRQVGRAEGGMATAIARRLISQDLWADGQLERPRAVMLRAQLRRQARAVWKWVGPCGGLAKRIALSEAEVVSFLRSPWFGAAWESIESASPVLARSPIAMTDLAGLIREAEPILRKLRQRRQSGELRNDAGSSDSAPVAQERRS